MTVWLKGATLEIEARHDKARFLYRRGNRWVKRPASQEEQEAVWPWTCRGKPALSVQAVMERLAEEAQAPRRSAREAGDDQSVEGRPRTRQRGSQRKLAENAPCAVRS